MVLENNPQARLIAACLVPLAWMSVSSGLILLNKDLMTNKGFKYPMTLSGLGQGFSAAAAFLVCRVLRWVPADKVVDARTFAQRMLPVGFFMALTLVCGNTVYMYLSVAFIQMLKAFTPVITMLGLFAFSLEKPTGVLVASVCVITAGTALAGYGELNASIVGLLIQLVSESAEAGRLIMTQIVLTGLSFHPIEAVFEVPAMARDNAWAIAVAYPFHFFAAASMGFAVMVLSFFTIQLCGSLTLKVLGTVKNAALVVFCVIFLAEKVTRLQGSGYVIALVGFSWYQYIKTVGPNASATTRAAVAANGQKASDSVFAAERQASGSLGSGGIHFAAPASKLRGDSARLLR